MARCTRGARHWFAYYGWVGSSAPVCRRCGAPNPYYDRDRDPLATDTRRRTDGKDEPIAGTDLPLGFQARK